MHRKILSITHLKTPSGKAFMALIRQFALVLTLVFTGATFVQAQNTQANEHEYVPAATVLQQLSDGQARQQIVDLTTRRGFSGAIIAPHEIGFGVKAIWVLGVIFHDDRIELRVDDREQPVRNFPYRDIPPVAMIHDTVLGLSQFGVPLDKTTAIYFIDGGLSSETRKNGTMRLADAIYALRHYRIEEASFDEKFHEIAAQYRALAVKPALPEEVRKYRVQAEFAVEQKRYDDAVRFYGEGIKLAPWWAQGHFNRALFLAERNRYHDAVIAMNKYLQLEPNALNARAAQDKVYQWESMTQVAPAPAPVSRPGGLLATPRGGGDCFIATAAYGSALDPHVVELRRFRDRYLLTNAPGSALAEFYYRHSPQLAQVIARNESLRAMVRGLLTPVVLAVAYPQQSMAALAALFAALLLWRACRNRMAATPRR